MTPYGARPHSVSRLEGASLRRDHSRLSLAASIQHAPQPKEHVQGLYRCFSDHFSFPFLLHFKIVQFRYAPVL